MAMMFRGTGKPIDQLDISLLQNPDPFGFGGRPDFSMNIAPTQQAPQAASKPKVGVAEILGGLGDVISAASGGQPSFLPQRQAQLEQQRMLQRRAQMAQDARNADWEDWVRKVQYKAANPSPTQGSEFERLLDAANLTPEQRLATIRSRVENTANPLQAVKVYNPDGSEGLQFIRPNMMGGEGKRGDLSSGGAPTVGTVEDGYRFKGGDPSKKENWESVGGQTATPSVGFR